MSSAYPSCLEAIRKMQKFGHIPSDAEIFQSYASAKNFLTVRMAALAALVDYTQGGCSSWTSYYAS